MANTPYQTPTKELKPLKLSAAIAKLQRLGLLRVDCTEPDAKAWIAPGLGNTGMHKRKRL
jgi:hypothetical protein